MFVAIQYWRINILLLLFAHDYVCILSFFFYGPLAPEIKDILSYLILSYLILSYLILLCIVVLSVVLVTIKWTSCVSTRSLYTFNKISNFTTIKSAKSSFLKLRVY